MRGRSILLLSVVLNLTLAVVAYSLWQVSHAHAPGSAKTGAPQVFTTNRFVPVYRKVGFNWSQLETADYERYIANLRSIGCPDNTIRDIIVCDVDALYAHRRVTDLPAEHAEWWRAESSTNYWELYYQKHREFDQERRGLLTKLLGPDWVKTELVIGLRTLNVMPALDGPLLDSVNGESRETIYGAVERNREALAALDQSDPGYYTNQMRAEQAFRAELARVLTPPQLEEYLLRYSENADSLRNGLDSLRYFNASPDEFRALFRATDGLDMQMHQFDGSGSDRLADQQLREELRRQREQAIRSVLGPQRYAEYQRLQDADYVAALNLVADNGGTPQTAAALYAINQASTAEVDRIGNQTNLNPLAQALELKKIELAQLQAQAQALGQAPPEPPSAPAASTQHHTVTFGDTAVQIAVRYGVPVGDLITANPGVDLTHLKPGQVVKVPGPAANPPVQ